MNGKRKLTRRILYALCILFAVFLLCCIPVPVRLKDGGSVKYTAVLYTLTHWHMYGSRTQNGYNTDGRYDRYFIVDNTLTHDDGSTEDVGYWDRWDFSFLPQVFGEKGFFDFNP